MANLGGFDASQIQPNSFEALPNGNYPVIITESDWNQTKSGTGRYLKLTLEVIDGQFKGRKLFDRLNLENQNTQAVEIARKTLSAICHAVGVLQPTDSIELHNLPMVAIVACRKNEQTGEMANEIKGYKPKGSATPAATADNTPPWKR